MKITSSNSAALGFLLNQTEAAIINYYLTYDDPVVGLYDNLWTSPVIGKVIKAGHNLDVPLKG